MSTTVSTTVEGNTTPSLFALMQLLHQHWRSPAIYAATQLGIAGTLADDSRTVTELAESTDTHAPSLYRLLRALARIGVFIELDGKRSPTVRCPTYCAPKRRGRG